MTNEQIGLKIQNAKALMRGPVTDTCMRNALAGIIDAVDGMHFNAPLDAEQLKAKADEATAKELVERREYERLKAKFGA